MAFDGDPNLKISGPSASSCRYCMNYMPLGRRGGHCQQLTVPVQSNWKACPLVIPAFSSSWKTLETLLDWAQEDVVTTENSGLELSSNVALQPCEALSAEAVPS